MRHALYMSRETQKFHTLYGVKFYMSDDFTGGPFKYCKK